MCYALNIPLIAVDTLQVLAMKAKVSFGWIVPMIDARRMEVYSAIFDTDYKKLSDVKAEIITETSYAETNESILFISDCPEKLKTVLKKGNFSVADEVVFPSANNMAALSFDKYKKNDTVDVAYFKPYYLKDFFLQKGQ
ncbi:tRNA threonylcarbamoyladenosine biosynthesis protein TsaB [Flavobacterium sp. 3HN19-14]|uniref:tRNA threonylcarbamoyladenosine biosynthesis protein TsaB n=1 Tax=Flavobacterium sp. 3HN19-14 TaxID=3448133 RepID=UPI003EE2ED2F